MIISSEAGLFDAFDFGAKGVDARSRSHSVFVVGSRQPAEEQRNRNHILHAMVAVGGVRERAFLVDDAQAGLVRADGYFLDGFGESLAGSSRARSFIAASTAVCAWNSAG